ncbi:receptor-type tyrosine-protein phosphatase alpha-like [Oscarella lobularis]|uniref:receptor-type tyrosine-protein phosphatase alpha-like n=1 Tax=Oscarella lobularis TaxID=121494 RepID=UPI0033134469
MNGFEDFGAYIVSQGPLENTTTDFWRMVWQQKAQAIVMLTNLEEKGRLKCHCYWPQDGSLSKHGSLCVAHQSTTVYADYVLRRFVVSMDDDVDNKSLDVVQYHYISWPDHGVPTDTGSVLNFLTRIRRNKNSNSGPMIVHCSAGVGRTGAFITIDTMLQRLAIQGDVDVYNYVLKLRERRVFMVQTAEQYIFIHQTIRDAIQWGDTSIPVSALKDYVTYKMEYVNGFKGQFDMLGKCPVLDESAAQKPTNMTKNRYRNYIPNNSFRVTLSLPAFGRSSDYINASHVSSLLHKDFFKIAQTPVEESVEDFWRMMWDQRCSIVVLMCHLRQGDEEHCFQFWPDSDVLKFKTFHVELEKETKGEHVTVREMKLVHSKTSTSNPITCFHFLDWPCEDKPPESAESLVSLIVDVQKQQVQSGNRPMAVICNNGVGRSGVFACLYSTIERMRCDRMVDIFQTVRAMRLQRSRLISNLELYKFCYKGALEYVSLFKDNDDD